MRWAIVPIGIATTFFSLTTAAFAQTQTEQTSPAALLGVQERSLQQGIRRFEEPANTLVEGSRAQHSIANDQFLLYEIDQNARVVVGPAINTVRPDVFSGNSFLGDNRLQLLHDLEP